MKRAEGLMPAAGWGERSLGCWQEPASTPDCVAQLWGFTSCLQPFASRLPGQEEPKPPESYHYPSLDVVEHGGSSVIPRRCISLLVFVCSSAHSELQLCLGLATAACNCSSSQTSVSLPQGWGWGCLGNAVGVVCLVVCSRNVGQTVKFFSPLVK